MLNKKNVYYLISLKLIYTKFDILHHKFIHMNLYNTKLII